MVCSRMPVLCALACMLCSSGTALYSDQLDPGTADISKYESSIHYFMHSPQQDLSEGSMPTLLAEVWAEVQNIYRGSLNIRMETVDSDQALVHCSSSLLQNEFCLLHVKPIDRDRTCILHPALVHEAEHLQWTAFVGRHNSRIELRDFFFKQLGFSVGRLPSLNFTLTDRYTVQNKHQICDSVSAVDLTANTFLKEYFIPQRPVVIREAFLAPSLSSILEVLHLHRDVVVGAKLSPDDSFEGVEELAAWQDSSSQHVPQYVLDQLQSPDKVVVRNAHKELTIGEVLRLIKVRRRMKEEYNATAANVYVEYLDMSHSPGLSRLYQSIMNSTDEHPSWAQHFHEVFYETKSRSCSKDSSDIGGVYSPGSRMEGASKPAEKIKPMFWLGDGNTLGKLHFDPFDNLLYQIQGEKLFRLSDPEDNARFYEGHMREAMLEAIPIITSAQGSSLSGIHLNGASGHCTPRPEISYRFLKRKLLESTSMVHSPVDIKKAASKANNLIRDVDYKGKDSDAPSDRYPLAKDINFVDCVVRPGEVLYVPSFWWHEVKSKPSREEADNIHLNIAVNFWFTPLFTKSFPCATCKKQLNVEHYQEVLLAAAERGLL